MANSGKFKLEDFSNLLVWYEVILNSSSEIVFQYNPNFIDKVRIYVRGGSGGNGLPNFGGRGGKGGKVYIVGCEDTEYTLKAFKQRHPKKRFIADPGCHSQ